MKPRDVIMVKGSEILGCPPTKAIVLKVLHEVGHPVYPDGLILVQCLDDPIGIYGHTDFEGHVYAGPRYADGHLARYV